jgi:predicted ribosome quality control (RQC) complex YloA/Tae2 family protein
MAETVTLNQARLHLGIGKEKLKRLLVQARIEPVQINRQRKEIGFQDLMLLQQFLDDDIPNSRLNSGQPVKTTNRFNKPTSQADQSTSQPNTIVPQTTLDLALLKERLEVARKEVSQLTNQLQSTEDKLERQLQEAKEERLAERRERENYQMLMMKLQQDNQQLRQQLLEAPKPSRFDVDAVTTEVEDRVDVNTPSELGRPAEPANDATRNKTAWAFGIGIGAVAAVVVLYVVVATSEQGTKWFPSMQEKVRGALQLTDSGSIVPYRYGDGGLR